MPVIVMMAPPLTGSPTSWINTGILILDRLIKIYCSYVCSHLLQGFDKVYIIYLSLDRFALEKYVFSGYLKNVLEDLN